MLEPPTLQEFTETVREAFTFLGQFGFQEVRPHPHRAKDPFQVWFRAGQRLVIVRGEGWGTVASVMLEHDNGLELAEIDLVLAADRPGLKNKRREMQAGQLQQVREAARRLAQYGTDFLEGDLTRFLAQAKPLPPYKRSNT